MTPQITFNDIHYVSDGQIRRADIVCEDGLITRITDKESVGNLEGINRLLLPGIIDDHIHSREPGLTHKGDLCSETHAAAAGGVTSVMDMPNVVPQTTNIDTLNQRMALGADHAFVNYAFYFGATNTNANLLRLLDPTRVPAVKLFMGSSTGGMLVDHGLALEAVFELSPLPIMAHCEDSAIIARNMKTAKERYGDDPDVAQHPYIRSREACIASSTAAVKLAMTYGSHLHLAHITTAEELALKQMFENENTSATAKLTLEACLPHLLFCEEDYKRLGTRIKCNPAVKTKADREALRSALNNGCIDVVATDHAPHLLSDKEGGCARAASGMPMVQFSLTAMMQLVEENVLPVTRLVELMCHRPADIFAINRRGYIREGMAADLVTLTREQWTLTKNEVVSKCGWSPLEGCTFDWKVAQTICNGHIIYDNGAFAQGNGHAQALRFRL